MLYLGKNLDTILYIYKYEKCVALITLIIINKQENMYVNLILEEFFVFNDVKYSRFCNIFNIQNFFKLYDTYKYILIYTKFVLSSYIIFVFSIFISIMISIYIQITIVYCLLILVFIIYYEFFNS